MANKPKTYTREDYDKLAAELEYLKTEGRIEAAEKIKVARSFGDLSENAEYDEAMNDQAKMEERIARLELDLRDAVILDESEIADTGTVQLGVKVRFIDLSADEEMEFKILGKSDIDAGIISDQSPIGSALMGGRVGDVVDVTLPSEEIIQLKILAISK